MTEDKRTVIQDSVEKHRRHMEKDFKSPQPMHMPIAMKTGRDQLQDEAVLLRWNQLADFFVKAHELHSVYSEERMRALDAADGMLSSTTEYTACEIDVADLQSAWQHAERLDEKAGDSLLEAWASTVAAQERLLLAVDQGLVAKMAASTSLDDVDISSAQPACGNVSSVAFTAHELAVRAVDKALWPVTEQIIALTKLGKYQQEEMTRRKLRGVAPFPLDRAIVAIQKAARDAADTSKDSGRQLVARALDHLGAQLCPATNGCKGMLMVNASFGSWTSMRPGDLVRGVPKDQVVSACSGTGDDDLPTRDVAEVVVGIKKKLLEQKELGRQIKEEDLEGLVDQNTETSDAAASSGDVSKASCDGACAVALQLHLAPPRSFINELWQRLNLNFMQR
jgi:hypothetical protein